jgi:xylitol oxidase
MRAAARARERPSARAMRPTRARARAPRYAFIRRTYSSVERATFTRKLMPLLTEQQQAEYEQNGWVLVPGVFTPEELAPLHTACDELLTQCGSLVQGNPRIQLEPETLDWPAPVVRKLEPVVDASPPLAALVHDVRMKQAAAELLGEEVYLYEDKLNYKPPHVGSSYPLHQDRSYWMELAPGVPSTDRLVTVAVLLDDATSENGCLRFVSGSHHGLMELQEGDRHALKADVMTATDAPGKAGDLLLFSCYTAHHSFTNRSDRGRRALLYTYNPVSDGDTYDIYKGAHGKRCRDWLAENGHKLAVSTEQTGSVGSSVPKAAPGYSDDDPRPKHDYRPNVSGAAGAIKTGREEWRLARPKSKQLRRVASIANHVVGSKSIISSHPSVGEKEDPVFGTLPLLRWAEIMQHNDEDDLWIVVAGRVWDMTRFVASDHPGGSEIPIEYGGKDASEFWFGIHGHLEAEILEDLVEGEGFNTGLDGETLPKLVGLCADDPPPEAMGTAGYERYVSRNWAGNVLWQHQGLELSFYEPACVEEVQELVRAHSKVRVLGKGHCFPALCDGGGDKGDSVVISLLGKMCGILSLDQAAKTVTVQGGTTYSQLTRFLLDETDFALPTAASLAHTTVAGSVATGSHGSSGIDSTGRAHLASNSAYITDIEIVVADGSILRLRRGDPDFKGAVTHCGCLGVVTQVTVQLVEDYDVKELKYFDIPCEHFIDNIYNMLQACTSFNANPAWHADTVMVTSLQTFVARGTTVDDLPADSWPETCFGAGTLSTAEVEPPTPVVGVTGVTRWNTSLYLVPAANIMEELQIEYFVPLEKAQEALRACWRVAKDWGEVVRGDEDATPNWAHVAGYASPGSIANYSHIRVIRADDQWISPTTSAHGQAAGYSGDTIAIAFGLNRALWGEDGEELYREAAKMEAALAPFGAQPHWGKLTTLKGHAIEHLYGERLIAFRELCNRHDPSGKFRNEWVYEHLFSDSGTADEKADAVSVNTKTP